VLDRILSRLERRLGFLAIANLAAFMAVLTAVVYVVDLVSHNETSLASLLVLNMHHVLHGQVWRLVTFLLVIPKIGPIWAIMTIYFYWQAASSLEQVWGTFKFNAYYFLGALLSIAASTILYFAHISSDLDVWYLQASLMLAYGTVFPNTQILLFGLIPLKAWWFAIVAAAYMLYSVIFPPGDSIAVSTAIVVAVANYLLFFGSHLYRLVRNLFALETHRTKHADVLRTMRVSKQSPLRVVRSCKICGISDDDGADLRVCVCQQVCHGKPTVYCLEHARSHQKKSELN